MATAATVIGCDTSTTAETAPFASPQLVTTPTSPISATQTTEPLANTPELVLGPTVVQQFETVLSFAPTQPPRDLIGCGPQRLFPFVNEGIALGNTCFVFWSLPHPPFETGPNVFRSVGEQGWEIAHLWDTDTTDTFGVDWPTVANDQLVVRGTVEGPRPGNYCIGMSHGSNYEHVRLAWSADGETWTTQIIDPGRPYGASPLCANSAVTNLVGGPEGFLLTVETYLELSAQSIANELLGSASSPEVVGMSQGRNALYAQTEDGEIHEIDLIEQGYVASDFGILELIGTSHARIATVRTAVWWSRNGDRWTAAVGGPTGSQFIEDVESQGDGFTLRSRERTVDGDLRETAWFTRDGTVWTRLG